MFAAILALIAALVLVLPTRVTSDIPDGVWAWAAACILFAAFWHQRKDAMLTGENPVIAVGPLVLGWMFVRYGLGALVVYYWDSYPWTMPGLDQHWKVHGGRHNLAIACQLAILASIGFYFAFRLPVRAIVSALPSLQWPSNTNLLKRNVTLYLPLGLFFTLFLIPRLPVSVQFIVTILGNITFALFVMTSYWWFSGTGVGRVRWMLSTLVACAMAAMLGAATGQVGQMFVPFMMVFFGYAVAKRRLPWAFLTSTALLALLVIGPFLTAYKHVTYDLTTTDASAEERVRYAAEYLQTISVRGGIELSVQRFIGRLVLIEFPAAFALYYPDTFEYLRGESFSIELSSLVPRLLWPDKPDMNIEINRYSQGVGLIRFGGATSAKFDAIAEYYSNFGPIGVLLLSGLHGYYLKVLYKWFMSSSDWLCGVSLHLLLFLLNFDFFGLGQVFAMHIKLVPVSIMVLYLLGRDGSRLPSAWKAPQKAYA